MAKSHPAQFDDQGVPQLAEWARNTVASFTLLACLVSLSIILHTQYGLRLAGAIVHGMGALDLTQLVNLAEVPPAPAVADANEGKYRAVGDYLARRYRVSAEMTTDVVAKAHAIGAELKLDPLLILAVISVESRFNPVAESVMGAKGLMQIIPRYHADKFEPLGGEKVAFEPRVNILVGAKILKEYLRRTGDLADALQLYVGATSDENENGYSGKVMAERDRLSFILRQFVSQNRTAQRHLAKPLGASI
jgi:soluble lytic murein transglycosylase-like protein